MCIRDSSWINFIKLRASFGVINTDRLPLDDDNEVTNYWEQTYGVLSLIHISYNSGFTSYTQASASVATYTPVLQEDGTIAYKKYGQNSQLKYEDCLLYTSRCV